MELSQLLGEARKRAGLTLRALAKASGTSAGTLHAYEHGAKFPSLAVARRIVQAAGFHLDVELRIADSRRGLSSDEVFKLELDRAIAEHLIADPAGVLATARRNLARARIARPVQESGWISEWEEVIERPVLDLVALLLASDHESLHLKQTSPFAGVLSQEERILAMERARRRRGQVAHAS